MRAVIFQEPGRVEVQEVPDPELGELDEAIVKIEACAVCGSDLHIYHGRVKIEPGFTIGHEFVGTVTQVGAGVRRVAVGDRVLGCFQSACGTCFQCLRGEYHRCQQSRTFGHGAAMGDLQGCQAEQVLVPHADMTLRRVPEGMSPETAIFAGDVMGTGYHAIVSAGMRPGDTVAVLGLGPVGLCAVQAARAAGAACVLAVDSVPERLAMAQSFGAIALDLDGVDVKRAVREHTEKRGVDVAIDAVGDPRALELAISLARPAGEVVALGVYAERCELHMGLIWIKGLTLHTGLANVIAHVDPVLAMMSAGRLDPSPLITHHMSLEDAAEAYALYDRREALKILLEP
ncbi:MAG TPA: alcohol dehydrogenase catalytic domain-containing protein [Solirubrobacteraceae bacterium]|jgi:2-desacetyl-2-hydroxyethyl bacteriochlorophyllide A dehydrogenase|nr:alcohol dehydrogenase catalytic domain-containing protein [Solirubrobacteraceae bacterium]